MQETGDYVMVKLLISLKHKPEKYDVKIRIYGSDGKLLDAKEYNGIKQLVIRAKEVRISRQIAPDPLVLILDTGKPDIEVKEGSLLYISG